VCATDRREFAWLVVNPCLEYPDEAMLEVLQPIVSSGSAVEFLSKALPWDARAQEHFAVLSLDAKNKPLGIDHLSVGSSMGATVDPRLILQGALLMGGVSLILCHNHPSGEATPSPEDIEITSEIANGCKLLGIHVLDHIILGHGKFFSFLDAGLLPGA
jgi:DNA repair protein RadC